MILYIAEIRQELNKIPTSRIHFFNFSLDLIFNMQRINFLVFYYYIDSWFSTLYLVAR